MKMKPPSYWHKGKKYLARKDKVMAKLIRTYKGHLTTRSNFFYSLTRSIVNQQVSVKSGDAIFSRFEKKCEGKINPKVISKLSLASLKSCGLSRNKAIGIKSLAVKILDKSFDPKLIKTMSDDNAINYLITLRQVGIWTSMMMLLMVYNRPNIWPTYYKKNTLDIGLLRAISINYKKKYLPPKSFTIKLQKKFSPYCTIACWFLWRSIDPENSAIQY